MHLPGPPSLLYLVYLLVVMPWLALGTRRVMAKPGELPVTRSQAYGSTLISLGLLLLASVLVARTLHYSVFAIPHLTPRELRLGAGAFAFQLGFLWLSDRIRNPEERRNLILYRLMPRTGREWGLFAAMSIAAGVAEEAAYRGVLVAILAWSTGSMPLAIGVSAAAFAVSHALQGWKSGVIILLMALSMQALAALTGTLVIGMVVHALYDLVAGAVGAWRVRSGQVEG